MNNPQTPKVILYSSKEIKVESNKQYLIVTDKVGEQHKISEKRQQLWGLFNEAREAEPFLLLYETYQNIQYIADVKVVADELLKRAVQDMGLKMADAQTEERNRSTSLSYAKDLVASGTIGISLLYEQAQKNYEFIKGIKIDKIEGKSTDVLS